MIYRLCFIGLLTFFLFSGCAAKKGLLNEIDSKTEPYENSMLCGQIENIEVIDKRIGVTDDNLEIPFISWPGQKDEIRPPLTQQLEFLILDEITNRSLDTGKIYSIEVNILEGLQRFEATWRSEKEYVKWKIEMLLQSTEGTASSVSDLEYFASSIDASHEFIDQLYTKTLRLSVLSGFSQVLQQLPDNNANCSISI